MKKMLALAIVLAVGGSAQAQLLTTPLYPLKVGTRWTYVVAAGKDAQAKDEAKKTVTVLVEREEPYLRTKKGADGKDMDVKNVGFILKMTSGAKVTRDEVVVLEDGVYKVHVAGTQMTPPLCFIKLGPAGKGWEADSKSGNIAIKGTFAVRPAKVKVPADKAPLDAFLISFNNGINGEERVEVDTWYVVNIGMVKLRVLQKGHENVLELEKFEPAK